MDILVFDRIPDGVKLKCKIDSNEVEQIIKCDVNNKKEWDEFGLYGLCKIRYNGQWGYATVENIERVMNG